MCAEAVGTGKTFIALAVAAVYEATGVVAIVPPGMVEQWNATARRMGVHLEVWTHSRLSRGRLPPCDPHLVIIDESHHFRNPGIRRYRTLAPWLVGRRLLLLSATPLVNHAWDLYHQLHLGIRDDALATDGAPSMRRAFDESTIPPALGRFLIQRLGNSGRPASRRRTVLASSGAAALLPSVDTLELSRNPGIAALVRGVLLSAASSSAAALEGALRRYRRLLLNARDAQAAGRPLDRASLRRFTAGADDQLLLWSLLPAESSTSELRLEDLPALEALLPRARELAEQPDEKALVVRSGLSLDRMTVIFVGARETVTYLRGVLETHRVAWCSGGRSGIGRAVLPRSVVLGWFRPSNGRAFPETAGRPTILIATDVAAEGLDLQSAGKIVHYDLPWTDVRREQRNGRLVRRGATHSTIEVLEIAPGLEIEARLHQLARLAGKTGLPRLHGLGPEGRSAWRWRDELSAEWRGTTREGIAGVTSASAGVLAGIALEEPEGSVVSTVLWRRGTEWTDDPETVSARIREAVSAEGAAPPSEAEVGEIIDSLAGPIGELLRRASDHRIAGVLPSPAALALGRRLRRLAALAVRRRDASQLCELESAFAFSAGGHTAGEEHLIASLLDLDDHQLLARLPALPPPSAPGQVLRPRLTGLICFRTRLD